MSESERILKLAAKLLCQIHFLTGITNNLFYCAHLIRT